VNVGLGKHRVVLELRLAERRSVSSDDDELGLAGTEGLESRLVSQGDYCIFVSQGPSKVRFIVSSYLYRTSSQAQGAS
jgi:hypothetical protein